MGGLDNFVTFWGWSYPPIKVIFTLFFICEIRVKINGDRVGCQKHSVVGVHLIYGKCIPLGMVSKKKLMEFSIKLAWWVLDALFVIKKQTKKLGLKTFYRAF